MAAESVLSKFLTGKVYPDSSRELLIETSYGKCAGKLWGPLDGEPVLALHGWQDCCTSFDRLLPLLPNNLLVVALDLLGHGHSDHHPAKLMYNGITYQMWIKEMVDTLRWETFILLVHSVSVSICLPFVTLLQQHRIKKVITLDVIYPIILKRFETVPNFLEAMELFEKQEADNNPRSIDRQAAILKMIETRAGLDTGSAELLMERATRTLPDGRVVFTRDPRLTLFILMGFRYHSFGCVEEMMKMFRAEWLMIVATDSEYLPYVSQQKVTRVQQALGANASKFEFFETHGGHYVHMTHPERIAAKITSFLEGGEPSRL